MQLYSYILFAIGATSFAHAASVNPFSPEVDYYPVQAPVQEFYEPSPIQATAPQNGQFFAGEIHKVTQASLRLNNIATSVNIFNCVLRAPTIILIFKDITQALILAATQLLKVLQPFDVEGQLSVTVALEAFVEAHKALLSTIIGKKGLMSKFFFLDPIRVVLVILETWVDKVAEISIKLIAKVELHARSVTAQVELIKSLDKAIVVYGGTAKYKGEEIPQWAKGWYHEEAPSMQYPLYTQRGGQWTELKA